MAKMKSKFVHELIKPLKEMVTRKHIITSLAKEAHLHTGRMQLYLGGDEHDGLVRTIISLREFVDEKEKENLRSCLYGIVDRIIDMTDEEYKEHSRCYKLDGFCAPTAIKKETLQDKKKK